MTLYSSPPPIRSFRDDKATLLVCWWCTIFAAVIIIFRVCGRYIRTERLFREDWLAFACMIPLFTRMALVHVVLLYGTNNTQTQGLSAEEIRKREIGSKLVLASRIFYAATLWMLKLTISEFFKRLISNIWRRSHEITLITIRWFLLATFFAVVIADLTECTPLRKAWQVVPDPGASCRQGYGQLLTMGVANVVTDFLLVFFPISIILSSTMRKKRKIQLAGLFAGSLLPAGTTIFRLPHIIDRHGSQQYRSLLASVEILFATAIANSLVLGSFVRDKGVKKQRWKFGSLSDSIERTTSRRPTMIRHWGSDEDLVRDLGINLDPELRGGEAFTPRPAPMATPALLNGRPAMSAKARQMMGGVNQHDWQFPNKHSGSESNTTDDDIDLMKLQAADYDLSPGDKTDFQSPRKVSFFDVGGLLDDNIKNEDKRLSSVGTMESGESSLQGALASPPPFNSNHNHANFWSENGGLSPPPRRGSAVLLQDIGGLLVPPAGNADNKPARNNSRRGYDLKDILRENQAERRTPSVPPQPRRRGSANSLQDIGGLLSPPSETKNINKSNTTIHKPSKDPHRAEDKVGYEMKDMLRQEPFRPTNRQPRSTSPMSKAKMRSAFDDLEPPRRASPSPRPNLAAQRDFGVKSPPPPTTTSSKKENDTSKSKRNAPERPVSLQDVGGLLRF